MAALIFNTRALSPSRSERLMLALSEALRSWALRRMVRRHYSIDVGEARKDMHARIRIGL